jgi:peptidyl-prolyl cis-trans isomerase A (cyclophilin A)
MVGRMKNIFLASSLLILAVGAAALAQTKAGPNLLDPSTMKAAAPATFVVHVETTKGPFTIKVTRAWAPNGADHFYNLVRAGFFTDAAFFRVIPGFMAQFGISARPEVSRIWANSNIQDDPVKESNKRGMVTFAQTSARNSRSTQLFINYGDNSRLDADRFAPFGEVTKGMDVVDKIYSGYGEQPDQGAITNQGKTYLDKAFPRLDRIVTAVIEAPADDSKKDDSKTGGSKQDDSKKDAAKKSTS